MDKSEVKEITLKEFIEQNHYLLSSMAVFIAIASFVKGLPILWLANSLFFLSIAGVVVVWFELHSQFPKKAEIRLFAFKQILSLGLIGFIFYWLLAFPAFWNIFLFVPLTLVLTAMFIKLLNQFFSFQFVRKIFGQKGKRNGWQKLLVAAYNFGIFVAVNWILYICINASPGFNYLLEMIRLNFQ